MSKGSLKMKGGGIDLAMLAFLILTIGVWCIGYAFIHFNGMQIGLILRLFLSLIFGVLIIGLLFFGIINGGIDREILTGLILAMLVFGLLFISGVILFVGAHYSNLAEKEKDTDQKKYKEYEKKSGIYFNTFLIMICLMLFGCTIVPLILALLGYIK